MAIKILGGLSAANLCKDADQDKINIQERLFDEGFTDGVQIRVGSDDYNEVSIDKIASKADSLQLPYIVHGPAEFAGVDLGQSYDVHRRFEAYQSRVPDADWDTFNLAAVSNALQVARGVKSLQRRVILHSGYSPCDDSVKDKHFEIIRSFLKDKLADQPFVLEAIPSLVIEEDGKITHYGFGATAEEMTILLKETAYHKGSVLIDFTHVGVTANQMERLPERFAAPQTYAQLISGLLDLGVSRFAHFSGHTKELFDVHNGFLIDKALDPYKQGVVRDALRELTVRYGKRDVYVALEFKFSELDKSRREIEAFHRQYIR